MSSRALPPRDRRPLLPPRLLPLLALLLVVILPVGRTASSAQVTVQAEGGMVFAGYNDVQVPRGTGTRFSLSRDLHIDPAQYSRGQVEWQPNERNTFLLLIAPLRLRAEGTLPTDLTFEGVTFPADTRLRASYDFNSYRLTWRRNFKPRGRLRTGLGLTAKIRDAGIRIGGGGRSSKKTNVGFVPLVHFLVGYRLGEGVELLIVGDALAAPQGRAEDVLAAVVFPYPRRLAAMIFGEGVSVDAYAGYRVVEGGADVEEVYNFALIHYAAFGVRISF